MNIIIFLRVLGNKIFRFNVIDFDNDLYTSPPTINLSYLFENVGGVNGCYTRY